LLARWRCRDSKKSAILANFIKVLVPTNKILMVGGILIGFVERGSTRNDNFHDFQYIVELYFTSQEISKMIWLEGVLIILNTSKPQCS